MGGFKSTLLLLAALMVSVPSEAFFFRLFRPRCFLGGGPRLLFRCRPPQGFNNQGPFNPNFPFSGGNQFGFPQQPFQSFIPGLQNQFNPGGLGAGGLGGGVGGGFTPAPAPFGNAGGGLQANPGGFPQNPPAVANANPAEVPAVPIPVRPPSGLATNEFPKSAAALPNRPAALAPLKSSPKSEGSGEKGKILAANPGFEFKVRNANNPNQMEVCQTAGQVFCQGHTRVLATAGHCLLGATRNGTIKDIMLDTPQFGSVKAQASIHPDYLTKDPSGSLKNDAGLLTIETKQSCEEGPLKTLEVETEVKPGDVIQWASQQNGMACGRVYQTPARRWQPGPGISILRGIDGTERQIAGTFAPATDIIGVAVAYANGGIVPAEQCSASTAPPEPNLSQTASAPRGVIQGNSGGGSYLDGKLVGILSTKDAKDRDYSSRANYTAKDGMVWIKSQIQQMAQRFDLASRHQSTYGSATTH